MNEERSSPPKVNDGRSGRSPRVRKSVSPFGSNKFGAWSSPSREERIRPSSWDESDDEMAVEKHEKSGSKTRRLYSADSKKNSASVASEINELKKQFFENMKKEKEEPVLLESRRSYDRRHSPARIRRRSRSSNSSSPVRETGSQFSSEERELDQISLKSSDYETKSYAVNYFSELKPKRMSLDSGTPGKEGGSPTYDTECVEMYNQLSKSDGKDPDSYLCKTSRKLSQILEVEENRRDLDMKSEENLDLFRKNFERPDQLSPLETARSEKANRVLESLGQAHAEKFQPLNFEEFANFHTIPRSARGSVSDRAGRLFQPKIQDQFISLSAKTGKTQLASQLGDESEGPFQYYCFSNPLGVKSFQADLFNKDKWKNWESNDSLKTDVTKNSTPRKSTERLDRYTDRIRKTKTGNPESPKFMLSIDSERSLKVEDMDSPDSAKKIEEGRTYTARSRNRSNEGQSPDSLKKNNRLRLDSIRKTDSETSRSENSFELRADSTTGSIKKPISLPRNKRPAESEYRTEYVRSPNKNSESREGQHNSPVPETAWSDLIDAFQQTSICSFNLDNHFPGFPREKENSWVSDGKVMKGSSPNPEVQKTETKVVFDASMREANESPKNRNLDVNEYLQEKLNKEELAGPLPQTPHNIFYFNVKERGPFGIGEFGDVTYCTAGDVTEKLQITGNSDTVDFGKPKDHGDGIPTQKQVIPMAADKREKDGKTQRQLWTELRRDVRAVPYKRVLDGQDDAFFTPRFIPISNKLSKSDNCINMKTHEGNHECLSKLKNDENRFVEFEKPKKETKSTPKTESESSESSSEDSENREFDCERTPRMSKSLSDLETQPPKACKENRLLDKAAGDYNESKVQTNLSMFLAEKNEKMDMRSNNWVNLKTPKNKQQKTSKPKTKDKVSSKEPFQEYLSVRKNRQHVPALKMRHSNCFQNFYKRFISVFCLTSNSSAATPK